ncbi:SPX domain-containing protein 1-like [Cornus florida]|uniref:SPX domain-containing protein 1-like n=1 Tax=Cornus florida TaxID=4283 RepID=UPI002896D256|nr:SPX domain-containing protein 1-like [Cornus florida]
MHFWKILNALIEQMLPDWRDKFLSYKDLKKQLKLIYPKEGEVARPNKRPRLGDETDGRDEAEEERKVVAGGEGEGEEVVVTKEVIDFVKLLEEEIEKFNAFFLDKQENYVIKLKVLQERIAESMNSSEELMKVGRQIVDFHGEMVLLENYSALNYTGLVKILKKYDKRSGALIRLPFIQKVLKQPFFTTDVLNELVKDSETMLDQLFSMNEQPAASETTERKEKCGIETAVENRDGLLRVPQELGEIKNMESMYTKLTISALQVLKDIRSGSSTVSMFSLPPLQSNDLEIWKNIPVLEQTAK